MMWHAHELDEHVGKKKLEKKGFLLLLFSLQCVRFEHHVVCFHRHGAHVVTD